MQVDMNVETREAVGKGVARTLRQRGKIPGVLYGQGECISLTIDPAEIRKVLHSESGSNTLLNVRIAKRSEEHTSELQSRLHLVCRLLLEKKKKNNTQPSDHHD